MGQSRVFARRPRGRWFCGGWRRTRAGGLTADPGGGCATFATRRTLAAAMLFSCALRPVSRLVLVSGWDEEARRSVAVVGGMVGKSLLRKCFSGRRGGSRAVEYSLITMMGLCMPCILAGRSLVNSATLMGWIQAARCGGASRSGVAMPRSGRQSLNSLTKLDCWRRAGAPTTREESHHHLVCRLTGETGGRRRWT